MSRSASVRQCALGTDVVVVAFVVAVGEEELAALVRSLHLRHEGARLTNGRGERREPAVDDVYSDSLLTVDFHQHKAELRGHELALTPLEFKLLATFVRHPEQVLGHDELRQLTWGDARSVSREQLRLTVSYLRRRLGPEGRDAIETIRGFGYRYRSGGDDRRQRSADNRLYSLTARIP